MIDAFEDVKRHKSDASVNKAKTYLLFPWQNLNFGTFAPGGGVTGADIVPPTGNHSGRNSKHRKKTSFLNVFAATKPDASSREDDAIPISSNGILLRGCVLRNTGWVIGIVLFTGKETKIMMNSGNTPSKRSKIDRQLNPLILLNFLLLTGMCLICSLISALYAGTFLWEKSPFSYDGSSDAYYPSYAAFVTFFSCMIIFQNIIPIALYISVDISKTVQSLFISMDVDMHDVDLDKYAAPQAWNLCDDLGQIEYIFSDKTGTLTCNTMEFRKCSINGVMYGSTFVTEASQGEAQRKGSKLDVAEIEKQRLDMEARMLENMKKIFDTRFVSKKLSFVDPQLHVDLLEDNLQSRSIRYFFTLLSICHTVLAEKPAEGDDVNVIDYKAQSPDEAALVAAARDVGFTFLKRTDNTVLISILGEERSYTILNVLEFNSDRKRMSVVIRLPEGINILLVKGADSVIFERLSSSYDAQFIDATHRHLETFANEGLRTLCLAYKVIEHDEYEAWNEKYKVAQNSIYDREKMVDKVAELIEHDLTLMGATAIEDKLQDGVPKTIETLAKSGIKIWVLTGDKMETAINIGFAANLLKKDMLLIVIRSTSHHETYEQLIEALERFWTHDGVIKQGNSHALVIDGISLKFALQPECRPLLLELGCRCRAVVCCRVSPKQKARVVSLVRKGLGAMCLAIGDGANDVSMIQEADVGIGIIGKEGLQAVMASDYAIGQFRFLGKLLLVHGRWGYMRTAELILNYFYKNILWLFVLFWYQFDCGFSAEIITDFTYGMFFNTLFTLLPTIIEGIFDQDINDRISMRVPQLYMKGIKQTLFTMERFWIYTAEALYQSLVIYYFSCLSTSGGAEDRLGFHYDKDELGTTIAFATIIIVNFYNGVNTSYWPWMTFAGIAASLGIWVAYVLSYASSVVNPTYGQQEMLLSQPQFFLIVLISVFGALMPRILRKFIQQYFFPTDTDIISEYQKYHKTVGGARLDLENYTTFDGVNEPDEQQSSPPTSSEVSPLPRVNSDHSLHLHAARRMSETSRPVMDRKRASSEGKLNSSGQAPCSMLTPARESAEPKTIPEIEKKSPGHSLKLSIPPRGSPTRRSMLSPLSLLGASSPSERTTPDGFIASPLEGPVSPTKVITPTSAKRPRNESIFSLHMNSGGGGASVLRKAGNLFRIRVGNTNETSNSPATSYPRASAKMSLMFMGTQEELPNLGFCFSHEGGMTDVITPAAGRSPSGPFTGMPDGGGEQREFLESSKDLPLQI
ncbi:hypothetical protein HK101_002390 [Irineochytrium annulatum]|nr:hypothetical protein HK101_002390 [Irineochytrium annulatum]